MVVVVVAAVELQKFFIYSEYSLIKYLQIFSHPVGCLFTLLIVSSDAHTLISMWHKLDLIAWEPLAVLLVLLPRNFQGPASWLFSSVLSSKSIILWSLKCESLMYFELICVYGKGPSSFFICVCPVFPSMNIPGHSGQTSVNHGMGVESISRLSFLILWSVCLFYVSIIILILLALW